MYAATGKTAGLTLADVDKPRTAEFVQGIEKSVVHYGSSTGFFGRKMFASGPQYLSAAVLYENMVIESYDSADKSARSRWSRSIPRKARSGAIIRWEWWNANG